MKDNKPKHQDDHFDPRILSGHLDSLGKACGFAVEPWLLRSHELLASWEHLLRDRLKESPYMDRASGELWSQFLRRGKPLLEDKSAMDDLVDNLTKRWGAVSPRPKHALHINDTESAGNLVGRYHFFGHEQEDVLHVERSLRTNVASFSRWNFDHASKVLEKLGLKESEVLVLTKIIDIPGTPKSEINTVLAHILRWVRENPEERSEFVGVKLIVAQVNPNVGQYGKGYRGANFTPIGMEEHEAIYFKDDKYISPQRLAGLVQTGTEDPSGIERAVVPPLPILLFGHALDPVIAKKLQQFTPMRYSHPYSAILEGAERVPAQHSYSLLSWVSSEAEPAKTGINDREDEVAKNSSHLSNDHLLNVIQNTAIAEQDNITGVAHMFADLGQGDVFIYASGFVAPFEMRKHDILLRPLIAKAVSRGAFFLYVIPHNRHWDGDMKDTRAAEEKFHDFVKGIDKYMPEGKTAANHVRMLYGDNMAILNIEDLKWDVLIRKNASTGQSVQGSILMPTGAQNDKLIQFSQSSTMLKGVLAQIHNSASKGNGKLHHEILPILETAVLNA